MQVEDTHCKTSSTKFDDAKKQSFMYNTNTHTKEATSKLDSNKKKFTSLFNEKHHSIQVC